MKKKYLILIIVLIFIASVAIKYWPVYHKGFSYDFATDNLILARNLSFTGESKIFNDKDVVFTGNQSGQKLEELYANAKMLVHPSENEGLPITVLQAMSYGIPTLVSDIPEHQEVITDSRFWFTNASVDCLVEKMTALLENPILLDQAGNKNKETAEKNYAWEDIAEKTESIYLSDSDAKEFRFKTV